MVKGRNSSRHTMGKGASHAGGTGNQTGRNTNNSGSKDVESTGGYQEKRGGKHPKNTLYIPPEK